MLYRAIVFKHMPATSDFSRAERVSLPGLHTAAAAQAALVEALREGGFIGGEVVAETQCGMDAETLLIR